MRLLEIASAEEQMALWRLVSDSVWTAIAKQSRQEAAEKAEKQRQAKLKPKSKPKAALLPKPIIAAPPPPFPKPKPLYPNKPKAMSTQTKQTVVQSNAPKDAQKSQISAQTDLTQGRERQV